MIKKIFSKEIFFLPLLLLTLFVSVNKVNADTLYISNYYDNYSYYDSLDTTIIDTLVSYYNNNWSSTYDYYIIWTSDLTSYQTSPSYIYLLPTNNASVCWGRDNNGHNFTLIACSGQSQTTYKYDVVNDTYGIDTSTSLRSTSLIYSSNTTLLYNGGNNNHVLQLPSYSSLDLGISIPQFNLETNYVIPTYITISNGTFVNGPAGSTGTGGLVITDIFNNPIRTLESVWSNIVSIFNLIGDFIILIPSPLREFLVSAFMLAIVLGILKILL